MDSGPPLQVCQSWQGVDHFASGSHPALGNNFPQLPQGFILSCHWGCLGCNGVRYWGMLCWGIVGVWLGFSLRMFKQQRLRSTPKVLSHAKFQWPLGKHEGQHQNRQTLKHGEMLFDRKTPRQTKWRFGQWSPCYLLPFVSWRVEFRPSGFWGSQLDASLNTEITIFQSLDFRLWYPLTAISGHVDV